MDLSELRMCDDKTQDTYFSHGFRVVELPFHGVAVLKPKAMIISRSAAILSVVPYEKIEARPVLDLIRSAGWSVNPQRLSSFGQSSTEGKCELQKGRRDIDVETFLGRHVENGTAAGLETLRILFMQSGARSSVFGFIRSSSRSYLDGESPRIDKRLPMGIQKIPIVYRESQRSRSTQLDRVVSTGRDVQL